MDARSMGKQMRFRWRYWSGCVVAGVLSLALAAAASAQVVVTVDGDTANATISLTGNNGVTYDADVTIMFDSPQNLTPLSLNLTAELVDPDDINARLRNDGLGNSNCLLGLLNCPTVDPDFPVMITVEPLDLPWLFASGFDGGTGGSGVLSFLNTYQIDVHTHDLTYTDNSTYRLYKAPVEGDFHDVTNDVMPGSVRVRGRGGDFSQFVVASDPRDGLTVSLQKILELNVRILAAALSDGLRLDLLGLLAQVDALILVDVVGALAALDDLIDLIDANAGTNIANIWTAHRDVVNDAGQMSELAETLRFSMTRILGATANP
jgi:hypothetical protein